MLALASPKKSPRGIARAHVGVSEHACVCAGVHIHTPQTLDKRHKKSFMQNKQAKYRTNKRNTEYKQKTHACTYTRTHACVYVMLYTRKNAK